MPKKTSKISQKIWNQTSNKQYNPDNAPDLYTVIHAFNEKNEAAFVANVKNKVHEDHWDEKGHIKINYTASYSDGTGVCELWNTRDTQEDTVIVDEVEITREELALFADEDIKEVLEITIRQ